MAFPHSLLNIREKCADCPGCDEMVPLPGMKAGTTYYFCKKPVPARQLSLEDIERTREHYERLSHQARQERYGGPLRSKLEYDALEGRTSFLSPEMHERIERATRENPEFAAFWMELTHRVRRGLNDEIVNGICQAVYHMMQNAQRAVAEVRAKAVRDKADTITTGREVLRAFDDACSRGDPLYMEPIMSELMSLLRQLEES